MSPAVTIAAYSTYSFLARAAKNIMPSQSTEKSQRLKPTAAGRTGFGGKKKDPVWQWGQNCGACCKLDKGPSFPSPEEIFDKPSDIEDKLKRRILLTFLVGSGISPAFPSSAKTKKQNPYDERRLLEQNKRIQRENNVPDDFPNFVREGFAVKVVTSDNYVKRDSGLVLWDIEAGQGDCPKDGQQVTFHYVGYNESGRRIDSTYLQGSPAKVRLGTNALIPGFEEGIRDMKPGGKRRIIIPPELGPPVGPSTFFSSKQFEVFDIELLGIQDCTRRTIGFYSDVVCGGPN